MLHNEVLTVKAKELFEYLSAFQKDFYLAGGTGLALQIGHRASVDFDLFSDTSIKKTLLNRVESVFSNYLVKVLINNEKELTVTVADVKFTFLHYPFTPVLPFEVTAKPINILSLKEILATKAYTLGRRGEYKDYVDMYTGLHEGVSTLTEIVELARKKYGDFFNDRLFLEQLLYLDDVEKVDLIMIERPVPSKGELLDLFSEKISELKV